MSNEEFNDASYVNNVSPELSHSSFLAKFYKLSSRISCRNFIAKINSVPDSDNDYEMAFLKRSSKVRSGFVFPDKADLACVSYSDIIFLLQTPFPVAQTARLWKIFRFADNLSRFNIAT